jgi:expansin (peptidoglycan-binding protein)
MAQDNTLARSLRDLGLATWFGGSLMGAVGLNGAAAVVDQPAQRLRVANAGWARWTPVNLAGIAAHLVGGAVLVAGNKGRLATQRRVATATVFKAAVTGLALGATAYSRALGERLMRAVMRRWRVAPPPPKRPRRTWPGRSGSSRCSSGSFPG